jgi:hypothetical protein
MKALAAVIAVGCLLLAPGASAAPPTVQLTEPNPDEDISGTETLDVSVTDSVVRVDYYVDDQLVATDDSCCLWDEEWDTAAWPAGPHTVVARATNAAGETGSSLPVTVVVPDQADPAPTPADYPHGLMASGSADYAQIAALGYDFVTVSAYRDRLDRAHAAGLKAALWLGGFNYDTCLWNWPETKLRTRLAEVQGHPAIHAYFIDDEPHNVCPNMRGELARRVQIVEEYDPDALTFIAENRPEAYEPLANVTDALSVVAYPASAEEGLVLSKIDTKVDAARAAGWQHIWGMPQTAADDWYRMASPLELAAIYARWHAVGAEAFVGFCWDEHGRADFLSLHPELWPTVQAENLG